MQVTASVLRNLSWRADLASKKILREVGAVTTLMKASMVVQKESTLKSILSALWNLSAHCSENKADICAIDGALEFLVSTLSYKSPSKTLAIIENGGGILRNVSSHIAVREDYRAILRRHNCLQMLLKHLKSTSLTIVSNACGTLWNLSARNAEDQQALWEMNAVSMLRNLVHSKHKMISMGSSAALKNLLSAKPAGTAYIGDVGSRPGLHARKQRALEAELDKNLAETCENIDNNSPLHTTTADYDGKGHMGTFPRGVEHDIHQRALMKGVTAIPPSQHAMTRSESRDSIGSTQSDLSHDRVNRGRSVLARSNRLLVERYQRGQSASPDVRGTADGRQTPPNHLTAERDIPLSNRRAQSMTGSYTQEMWEPNQTSGASLERRSFPGSPRGPKTGVGQGVYGRYANLARQINQFNTEPQYGDDQPVNYGLQYNETNSVVIDPGTGRPSVKVDNFIKTGASPGKQQHNLAWHGPVNRNVSPYSSMNRSFSGVSSGYAETDLDNPDQPTDFSKRYAELHDTSEDHAEYFKNKVGKNVTFTEFVAPAPTVPASSRFKSFPSTEEDTVRAFHTEGTPLNFSTATSMTDLTQDKDPEMNRLETQHDAVSGVSSPDSRKPERGSPVQSGTSPTEEPIEVSSKFIKKPSPKQEDGHDKAKEYCVEGTPVCFSRVSSLSSLNSAEAEPSDERVAERENVMMIENIDDDDERKEDDEDEGEPAVQRGDVKEDSEPYENQLPEETETCEPQPSHTIKTVTFDETPAEATPLMFSRCSSFGSLSSFEQRSIHDDRSSVYSEFNSRRTSGAVSPSDLPDSPSETMPPSPHTRKPAAREFQPIKEETSSKENSEHSLSLVKPNSVFDDSKAMFHVEGTPLQFSTATSLSDLTMDEPRIPVDAELKRELKEKRENHNDEPTKDREVEDALSNKVSSSSSRESSDHASELSEVSENEDDKDILAACISIAMPVDKSKQKKFNRSKVADDATSPTAEPLHAGIAAKKQVNFNLDDDSHFSRDWVKTYRTEDTPLDLSKAPSPTKEIEAKCTAFLDQDASVAYNSEINKESKQTSFPRSPANMDSIRTFAVEGTPLNISTQASSLSDLSLPAFDRLEGDGAHQDVAESHCRVVGRTHLISEDQSETSSMCDEGDYLLEEAIQLSMPKVKPKRPTADIANTKQQLSVNHTIAKLVPINSSLTAIRASSEGTEIPAADSLKTYAVEGTPVGLSSATSLSDLTVESTDVYHHNANSDLPKKPSAGISGETCTVHRNKESSVPVALLHSKQHSYELPRTFAIEGTPATFSCADSLSDLSLDGDIDLAADKATLKKNQQPEQNSFHQPPEVILKHSPNRPDAYPVFRSATQVEMCPYRPEDKPLQSTEKSANETPMMFSRHSSLDSVSSAEQIVSSSSGHQQQEASVVHSSAKQEHDRLYKVEDTPVCFSRNSSLSSLSIESVGAEPSASEQALLDECISAALPKNKPLDKPKVTKDVKQKLRGKWKLEKKLSEEAEEEMVRDYGKVEKDLSEKEKCDDEDKIEIAGHPLGQRGVEAATSQAQQKKENEDGDECKFLTVRDDTDSESARDTGSVNSDLSRLSDADMHHTESDVEVEPFEEIGIIPDMAISAITDEPQPMLASGVYSESLSMKVFDQACNIKEEGEEIQNDPQPTSLPKNGKRSDQSGENDSFAGSGPVRKSPEMVRSHNDEINEIIAEGSRVASHIESSFSSEDEPGGDNRDADDSHTANETLTAEPEPGELDITMEANLVLTQLKESKQDYSLSTQDDEIFLEDETLSLVSTDCMSECSSLAESEHWSETSGSAGHGSRPRILKPGEQSSRPQQEERGHGIRGRRKPLYGIKRQPNSDSAVNVTSVRGAGGRLPTAPKPVKQAKVVQKTTPPKSGQGLRNNRDKQVEKTLPNSPTHLKTKPSEGQKKPKPIIKQGTFTKDKPTQNGPKISPTKPTRGVVSEDIDSRKTSPNSTKSR